MNRTAVVYYHIREIASLFSVSLSTIYKYLPVGTAANDDVF
ncbi:hypothetical protein PSI15_14320 [Xenorhabdus sp. PR6a]|nr:helix-turn-helix domain-containing protein [Xenorhabdus sp. PR6a]MDC9582726.1 hypothetical protein [Xenorhabdus sp. PR6a]